MTEPRALVLVGELKANDDYFAQHWAPAAKTDITDQDGVVYRYFAGRCFEFHPLADFGALNAHIAAHDADATQRLADALIARGVYQSGGGIAWEYTFPYAGGRAPWLSGMAQAVAAQAFAGAAALVPERETAYMREAQGAYRVIPKHLLTSVPAGPWIRLYSFGSLRVLNAQLQTVVSLQSYAVQAEDDEAGSLAARMQRAAAATLASFDTGYWTYYALPNDPSPLDYQQYVVQLLHKLAATDPRFADAAARIGQYEKQPPAFKLETGNLGALRFWLSKPATVQANTGAGPTRRLDPRRRLAHVRLERAEAPGRLPGACDRGRFDRQQVSVRRTADRPSRVREEDAREDAINRRDATDAGRAVVCGRRGARRPGTGQLGAEGRAAPCPAGRDLAAGRDDARPDGDRRACAAAADDSASSSS